MHKISPKNARQDIEIIPVQAVVHQPKFYIKTPRELLSEKLLAKFMQIVENRHYSPVEVEFKEQRAKIRRIVLDNGSGID